MDETSPGEENEREITQIEKSEEEEYRTESEDDDEEEAEYSPPEIRKIQIQAALRMTPIKATPRASLRTPTSQGGSSQKKARKAK